MSACQYTNCSAKTTDGYKYCQCHSGWIRRSGLCYECLQKKEDTRFKLCSACHQKELAMQARPPTCHFPDCAAAVTGEHRFCQCHHIFLLKNGLCYNCCGKKEITEFKLCQACHQAELRAKSHEQRQEAIRNGLCTNYWKCKKPAVRRGAMCEECYQEYLNKVHPEGSRPEVPRPLTPITTKRAPLNIARPMPVAEENLPTEADAPKEVQTAPEEVQPALEEVQPTAEPVTEVVSPAPEETKAPKVKVAFTKK